MPTILREGPYRFFFYPGDAEEPQHIRIERDGKIAKVWLDPVRLQSSGGFGRSEISNILKIIESNQQTIVEGWNDYFGDRSGNPER